MHALRKLRSNVRTWPIDDMLYKFSFRPALRKLTWRKQARLFRQAPFGLTH